MLHTDVSLKNFGNRPALVVADMKTCCEQITETDIDCNYSYNRRGKCDIRINITFNSNQNLNIPIIQRINFDTYLTRRTFSSLLTGGSKIKCQYPDEDPLDSCLPVNCHMKYSGHRGFYSASEKKCVRIPKCQSNMNINQAYLWSTNQCVDLNNTVTQKDIQEVLYRIENNKSDELFQKIDNIHISQKIRCHNGRVNNFTDLCDCYSGWENEKNMNLNDFIPSTIPLQMCTVRKHFSKNIKSLTNDIIPRNWTFIELIFSILFSSAIILLTLHGINLWILNQSEISEITV
ncbi:uncharacterized protein LOC112685424 isoform X2 [Sipha flava]|uniref:Uncharacterized protein LOC112685424 isoform X2 n=1 Tax=Sipha flava TaxID=143950 RepID=A0A8B8FRH1_9HEMI|nr:uncharacterized protein LOC112685424 isoform X2 [Sipha flava]